MLECDRRSLLAGAALAVLVAQSASAVAFVPGSAARRPRLAFFDDRPMVDRSGTLPEFQYPDGFRGADGIGRLSEQEWRSLNPFG